MEIIYLLNSGFLLRMGDTVLIFDDYRDPAGAVERELAAAGEAYIFASHAHFDHFDGHILKYAAKTSRYFLSDDIRQTRQAQDFPAEKTTYLKTYDSYAAPDIRITTFDSTDLGTSFLADFPCGGFQLVALERGYRRKYQICPQWLYEADEKIGRPGSGCGVFPGGWTSGRICRARSKRILCPDEGRGTCHHAQCRVSAVAAAGGFFPAGAGNSLLGADAAR